MGGPKRVNRPDDEQERSIGEWGQEGHVALGKLISPSGGVPDEREWFASCDAIKMLATVLPEASDRRLRLWAVACCRLAWQHLQPYGRAALEAAEVRAEGGLTDEEYVNLVWDCLRDSPFDDRIRAHLLINNRTINLFVPATDPDLSAATAAEICTDLTALTGLIAVTVNRELSAHDMVSAARRVALIRCVWGNPFRPRPTVLPAWLTWEGGVVAKLAGEAYEDRGLPYGLLDGGRLAVLADALEEAGCADEYLLGHLRGPAEHVRGCFVLDALLGKG
jgi:hypothetical protein